MSASLDLDAEGKPRNLWRFPRLRRQFCRRNFVSPSQPSQSEPHQAALEIKEIKQIIELMNDHDLSLFHLERDGVKIKLKKGADLDAVLASLARSAPSQQAAPADPAPGQPHLLASPVEQVSEFPVVTIKSPTVGTFYRQSEPESPPFVKVGDKVDEDTVVCIIEAMKVMNEIKAETKGTIQKIFADDSKPVQFGDPLFEILPG